MEPMVEQFKNARRVSVPIIGIETVDPQSTLVSIAEALKPETPLVQWDSVRGYAALNKAGAEALPIICGSQEPSKVTNPTMALSLASAAPPNSVVFILNATLYMKPDAQGSTSFSQAIWNLRDAYKGEGARRTLVLISVSFILPPYLEQDVYIIRHELPTDAEREALVKELAEAARVLIGEEDARKAAVAMRGLGPYASEQAAALAIKPGKSLDMELLYERCRQQIEARQGLQVWRGKLGYESIGGLDALKDLMGRKMAGKYAPSVYVFVDELEKVMGSTSDTDSSGVGKDAKRVLLTEMEDNDWSGLIMVGPPGVSKSAFAKATGAEAGKLIICLDMGGFRSRYVGDSEQNLRAAMAVIKNIAGEGGAYFIATSNGISEVAPELKRRFRDDVWYVDMPTKETREAVFAIWMERLGLPEQDLPESEGWTGAQIVVCCKQADEWGCSLIEAAEYTVPLSVSDPDTIETLRAAADGRWKSADHRGLYKREGPSETSVGAKRATVRRTFAREED